jgi:hypothetical protein
VRGMRAGKRQRADQRVDSALAPGDLRPGRHLRPIELEATCPARSPVVCAARPAGGRRTRSRFLTRSTDPGVATPPAPRQSVSQTAPPAPARVVSGAAWCPERLVRSSTSGGRSRELRSGWSGLRCERWRQTASRRREIRSGGDQPADREAAA